MPGTRNMAIGALFAVGGTVLTYVSFVGSGGSFGIFFYGAVIVGIIQFAVGLFQWTAYQAKSPEKRAEHHAKVDIRLLLRSMIAVAASDGKLEEGEAAIIQFVSRAVLGEAVDKDTIRKVFNEMRGADYIEELSRYARETTQEGADLAVKSAVMVSLSDGEMTNVERTLIAEIARALNVTGKRLNKCVEQANDFYASLIAEQMEEESYVGSIGAKTV